MTFYKRKEKPKASGAICPACGARLKDFELINGCFKCKQMSKVNSYRCDYCGEIKEGKEVVGISETQDLFDNLTSYAVINNNEKANVHLCGECYSTNVIGQADFLAPVKKDREANELKRKELAYVLRHACVTRAAARKKG